MDSLSSLRVSQRLFAHHGGGTEMGFYRLSMSIECATILTTPAGNMLPGASSSLSPGFYIIIHHRELDDFNKGTQKRLVLLKKTNYSYP